MTAHAFTQDGFVHEAAIYAADAEFVDMVAPFLHDGVAAGEPTLLSVGQRQRHLLRDALGGLDGVTALDGGQQYADPLTTLQRYHDTFREYVDGGATRIRIVGEIPHPGSGGDWPGWVRYEASLNHLFAALPVWSICPYDARTSAQVLADVERTHARMVTPDGGHATNPRFTDPDAFLAEHARAEIAELHHRRPDIELTDPSLSDARLAVATLAMGTNLAGKAIGGLVFAVNEVLTNAIVHGRRPVHVRGWAGVDRVTVGVTDRGPGTGDPYAGLLRDPAQRSAGGLWLARRTCHRITLADTAEGFAAYATAQTPADDGATRHRTDQL